MPRWLWIVGAIVTLIAALGAYLFMQVHAFRVEPVTDDLWVGFGLGGNVGILRTGEGAVIVDTLTLTYQGERIRAVAEEVTGEPVVMVINTHYHLDHTHGNPAFAEGTRVVATHRTLHHLQQTDAEYFSGPAAALLPNETFTDTTEIRLGNKTIQLMHPGPGHTANGG